MIQAFREASGAHIISFIFAFSIVIMVFLLIGLTVKKREIYHVKCKRECETYIVKYKDPSGRCICSKELFVGDGGLTDEEKATE